MACGLTTLPTVKKKLPSAGGVAAQLEEKQSQTQFDGRLWALRAVCETSVYQKVSVICN